MDRAISPLSHSKCTKCTLLHLLHGTQIVHLTHLDIDLENLISSFYPRKMPTCTNVRQFRTHVSFGIFQIFFSWDQKCQQKGLITSQNSQNFTQFRHKNFWVKLTIFETIFGYFCIWHFLTFSIWHCCIWHFSSVIFLILSFLHSVSDIDIFSSDTFDTRNDFLTISDIFVPV